MKSVYYYESNIAAGEYSRHQTDDLFGHFFGRTKSDYRKVIPDVDFVSESIVPDERADKDKVINHYRIHSSLEELNDGIGLGAEILKEVEKTRKESRKYI